MWVSKKILRNSGRDIIKVRVGRKWQPFYRSTGNNSGKPGVFLPFDGLLVYPGTDTVIWFDKGNYISKDKEGNRLPLNRYGTEKLKEVSDYLSTLEIPAGKETPATKINKWLRYGVDYMDRVW